MEDQNINGDNIKFQNTKLVYNIGGKNIKKITEEKHRKREIGFGLITNKSLHQGIHNRLLM